MSRFHKNKYYRVKEKIDISGRVKYVVESSNSWLDTLFGIWSEYKQQNNTLDEAIEQIKIINTCKIKIETIVYKTEF